MFLLRPIIVSFFLNCAVFTFQYVSIKTRAVEALTYYGWDLHSNMFLLRQRAKRRTGATDGFTFQYVSIKTTDEGDVVIDPC